MQVTEMGWKTIAQVGTSPLQQTGHKEQGKLLKCLVSGMVNGGAHRTLEPCYLVLGSFAALFQLTSHPPHPTPPHLMFSHPFACVNWCSVWVLGISW